MVALVAAGSMTGSARVLQNGVMSNAVPFTVDALQITSLSPASGAPGTSVTISGSGFGSSQGSGLVMIGGAAAPVTSWSDTQVVVTIPSTSLTGIVRVQQNGVWSNALTFTVPPSGGNSVTLSPNFLTMLVGDTHTIQALNSSGQPVTGLTWTSSDPAIVSLSTADPPLLTALAVGHATITAGTASADVTVSAGDPNYPGTLPLGTVLWSVPGNVTKIVPAVPSPSGVADVFAMQCPNDPTNCYWGPITVQAITSDGTTAWTAQVIDANSSGYVVPDFLGGLVAMVAEGDDSSNTSIVRFDGTTGAPTTVYTPTPGGNQLLSSVAVHPDGTIFAAVWNYYPHDIGGEEAYSLIGIDPTTGAQKFSVQATAGTSWESASGLMIAGDGYAYLPYSYNLCDGVVHLALLRVNSSGASDDMHIADSTYGICGDGQPPAEISVITNADQGVTVVVGWMSQDPPIMAVTAGTSVSIVNAPFISNQQTMSVVQPVLQAQDGSYIGTIDIGWDQNNNPLSDMVAFDQTGAIRWMVPGNYQPQIATADGGLIATDPSGSAYTFDQYGNATGVLAGSPTYSWTGNSYQQGSVHDVVAMLPDFALSFAAFLGGSPSGKNNPPGTSTAVRFVPSLMFLPFGLSDTNPAANSQFYEQVQKNLKSTQIAIGLLPKTRATVTSFDNALAKTNMFLGFIGHSLTDPTTHDSMALCLSDGCIAPQALLSGSQPLVTQILPNGFAPNAKVVFLGACGLDANFLAQWHLRPSGQALIAPKYLPSNTNMLVNLDNAAWEWDAMLVTLAQGKSVNEAVVAGNQAATYLGSGYQYVVIGDGSVNISTKSQ